MTEMKKMFFAIMMMVAPMSAVLAQTTNDKNETTAAAVQTTVEDDDAKYATELLPAGTQAPDFSLAATDGTKVTLSGLRGKFVVLDFWASWCPDCRKDLPKMAALHKTYAAKGVEFVGVSFDDKKENLEKTIADFKIPYTQVSELKKWKETKISAAYKIKWIPSMYVISPEGKVILATVMADKLAAKLAEIFPGCDEQSPASCCGASQGCCKKDGQAAGNGGCCNKVNNKSNKNK